MVLRSDSERLDKELAAAGKSSKQDVIEKYRSVVCERDEVSGCSVPCNFANSFILQFVDAMEALEGAAERLKEDARAEVKEQRMKRCAVGVYPRQTH